MARLHHYVTDIRAVRAEAVPVGVQCLAYRPRCTFDTNTARSAWIISLMQLCLCFYDYTRSSVTAAERRKLFQEHAHLDTVCLCL